MATPTTPDSELIARTLHGDAGAFEALVRRHYEAAFAVALAYTVNRADAEDLCHDAFVRAGAKLDDCRDRERFRYWLCAIVRNQALNAAERARVRRTEPLEAESTRSPDDPSRDAERAELRTRLTSALGKLSTIQREVVLLHDLQEWTHEMIATTLGVSVENSRQLLFQARKRLRATLGPSSSREHFDDR